MDKLMADSMVADGMVDKEIPNAYPDWEHDDIHKVPTFAAEAVRERAIPLILPYRDRR